MTVPGDSTIQEELLQFLLSRPNHSALPRHAYDALAALHPELTAVEKTRRYQNSISLWANRVQFARLHLAERGLLFRSDAAPGAPRGVWKLTPKGIDHAKAQKPELQEAVQADIEGVAFEHEAWEGAKRARLTSYYERDPKLRSAAVKIHGTSCKVCDFNFEAAYGAHGKDYIEVHHLVPVSTLGAATLVNPTTDMTVLCSNCHRMIHRHISKPLSVEDLRAYLRRVAQQPHAASGSR